MKKAVLSLIILIVSSFAIWLPMYHKKSNTINFVEIPKHIKVCEQDSDCMLVETLCSSCCGGNSINKQYEKEYLNLFHETCKNYSGAVCDCMYGPKIKLICQDNICNNIIP